MKLINILFLLHFSLSTFSQFNVDWNVRLNLEEGGEKVGGYVNEGSTYLYFFYQEEYLLRIISDSGNETLVYDYWYFSDTLKYYTIDLFYTDSTQTIIAGQIIQDGDLHQVISRLDPDLGLVWVYQQADEFGPVAQRGLIAKPDTTFILTYSYLPFTYNNYGYIVLDGSGSPITEMLVERSGLGTSDILVEKGAHVWTINQFDSLRIAKYTKTGSIIQDTCIAWPLEGELTGGGSFTPPVWNGDTLIMQAQVSEDIPAGIQRIIYSFEPASLSNFSFHVLNEPEFFDCYSQWNIVDTQLEDLQVSDDVSGHPVAVRTSYSSSLELIDHDSVDLESYINFTGYSAWIFDQEHLSWIGYFSHLTDNSIDGGQAALLDISKDSIPILTILDEAWTIYSGSAEILSDEDGFILYNKRIFLAEGDSSRAELTRVVRTSTDIEEPAHLENIILFPNPFHSNLSITGLVPGNYQCRLLDLSGREVYRNKVMTDADRLQLQMGDIPNGYYLLELSGKEKVYRQSVVRF